MIRLFLIATTIAAFALGLVIFKATDFRCRPSDNTLKIGGVLMAGCEQHDQQVTAQSN